MATIHLDLKGLRCPQPVHEIISHMHETAPGDIIEAVADCPTFEQDVRNWAERTGKTLLAVTREGDVQTAQIQL